MEDEGNNHCLNQLSLTPDSFRFVFSQSLSVHLTSTKGPIEVLLCPDEDTDPSSPVKNGSMDINGNSPFLRVLQGLFSMSLLVPGHHMYQ